MAKTSRQSFQFMLRLPDELRESLKTAADQSGRSMTAEILARLEAADASAAAEAMEWRARHDQLQADYDRLQALYEDERQIIQDQRSNMSQANVWILRHLRTIESLCDILLSLEGEPDTEVKAFADKMQQAAAKTIADFERRPDLMASIGAKTK